MTDTLDLNTKIKTCQLKNSLFNNKLICWDEKTEFYNNCRYYISNTIALNGSPWAKGSSVISYYKRMGLSVLQKRIIQYLHNHFFQWGSPAYLKMQTLAKRLKTTRQAIYRAIGRLVKRKILHRVHIFSEKYKQQRSIILPINPLKIKLINKINHSNIKRFHLHTKEFHPDQDRRNRLVSKQPKSFQNQRQLIDYIYTNNIIFSNLLIKESFKKNIPSEYTERKKRSAESSSLMKGTKMNNRIPKYKLKVRETFQAPADTSVFDNFNQALASVDFNLFVLPPDQQRNILNYVEKRTFDFEFNKFFSPKRLAVHHEVAKREIQQLMHDYLKLYFTREPLDHKVTSYILRYWNDIENPKFSRHKIDNPESMTYVRLLILTNYMLKYYFDNDINKFLLVIERIEMYGSQNHYLANTLKKWKLDQLLLLRKSNGMKKYFVKTHEDFEDELFKYRSKHFDAAKRFKRIYLNAFYRTNKEKGLEAYKRNNNKLDSFLDLLINRLKHSRRELYMRNLTQRKIIDGYETDSILSDYCDWISYSIDRHPNIFDLCNYDLFMQFVYLEMRGVRGMKNFWKPIRA